MEQNRGILLGSRTQVVGQSFVHHTQHSRCSRSHRDIGGSSVFFNYAVWESVEHFKRAFSNPDFQSKMKYYPPSAAASPHLVKKVAVPGICVG